MTLRGLLLTFVPLQHQSLLQLVPLSDEPQN